MTPFRPSSSRLLAILVFAGRLFCWDGAAEAWSDEAPLIAHAHNDYAHKRPLLDALERGFHSVEADAVLHDGQLLVGHTQTEAAASPRTLEDLYLKPLETRVRDHDGAVYDDRVPFFLLIDIKTDAEATYRQIHEQLARHAAILSVRKNGEWTSGAVTVVISGNVPLRTIAAQPLSYAGIDGRPADIERDLDPHVMPWISAQWGSQFRWNGQKEISEGERQKLRDYVAAAHARHRLVRFWGTPERETFWKELRTAGVDLIGTDDLPKLEAFCREVK